MHIGLIGLGKMGANMRERIRSGGHEVSGYSRTSPTRDVSSLEGLVAALPAPRVVIIMVPAGAATAQTITTLGDLLSPGDLVVDGGNSKFTDDIVHAEQLKAKGIGFVDCGVSGGVWGQENGYGLMCGGDAEHVEMVMPIFDALRPEGPRDEGFELLMAKDSVKDVPGSFKAWTRGTVVRSWLLDLMVLALEQDEDLGQIRGYVNDSGEGRWTVEEALAHAVPLPVITAAVFARFSSRQDDSPQMKAVAALRNQFGGHAVTKAGESGVLTDH